MRYIWDLYDDYFGRGRAGFLTRVGMRMFRGYLRRWDVRTARAPHYFIANSANVKRRIEKLYNRTSDVIYPPVNTSLFEVSRQDGGYYLIVSAFVPYKRIDLAIEVFNITKDPLVIVGDGPDDRRLRAAAGAAIRFTGWQSEVELKKLYARCKAVIFPGEEDFGIVPLEAMASGKPVIAFAKGGACETVFQEGEPRTGILFQEQTAASLVDAIRRFKASSFDEDVLRAFAMRFDREVYKRQMKEYAETRWKEFKAASLQPSMRERVTESLR